MVDTFSEGLAKNLSCPLCNTLFISPVIASCCGNTFCINCIGNGTKCPVHKKFTHYTPNRILQSMIDEIPFKCVCGESVLSKMRNEHSNTCIKVLKKCKFCGYKGNLEERVKHFADDHAEVIIERFSEIV